MSTILTLDLGTTYFKAALFDTGTGRLMESSRLASPVTHPHDGWWELSVDGFLQTIDGLLAALRRSRANGLTDVAAISFATQTNSFTLLDSAGECLIPFILWPDTRAHEYASRVELLSFDATFYATTGVPALSCEFMPAKLLWLQENRADVWKRAHKLCLIGDYLTWWLTGRHATEAGAAGLTGLVDIHALQWQEETADVIDLPLQWLPDVVRSGTDVAAIRSDRAQEFGLPDSCRVVVGCLDQYAGAIGAGNTLAGGISETTGTVLATVRCANRFRDESSREVFQGPGFRAGLYYQMVFGSTSANLLEAYRNRLDPPCPFSELDAAAVEVPPGVEGLRIHADLSTAHLEGLFIGINETHSRGQATRAILEAVAFALAEQIDTLTGGKPPDEIRSVGGAARSALWLQIKADVLGCSVAAIECPEPTSLGAAILAQSALDNAEIQNIAQNWVRIGGSHKPDPEVHAIYKRLRGLA